MGNRLITATVLFCVSFFAAQGQDQWNWHKAGKGVEYCSEQIELFGGMECISAVRYKACRHRTRILCANGPEADSTSALAQRVGAIAAVNASYFDMKTREPVTYIRQPRKGVVGHTIPKELVRTDGVLAIKCSGRIGIFKCDTTEYSKIKGYREIIAAGPVLLKDGQPARESWPESGFFTRRHPRTVVGRDKQNRVYLIVIDGRFPGEGEGTTIDETMKVCQMLDLEDALNFDGGGSCALWETHAGVLSHPHGNRIFDHYGQRIVPNILYIK